MVWAEVSPQQAGFVYLFLLLQLKFCFYFLQRSYVKHLAVFIWCVNFKHLPFAWQRRLTWISGSSFLFPDCSLTGALLNQIPWLCSKRSSSAPQRSGPLALSQELLFAADGVLHRKPQLSNCGEQLVKEDWVPPGTSIAQSPHLRLREHLRGRGRGRPSEPEDPAICCKMCV